MIINDLYYLEVVEKNRVVGGNFNFDTSLDFSSNVDIFKDVDFEIYIVSDTDIYNPGRDHADYQVSFDNVNTFAEVYVSTYTDKLKLALTFAA